MKRYIHIFLYLLFAGCCSAADVSIGQFNRIYDPSIGEKEQWFLNDHCFVLDANGVWHLFGITDLDDSQRRGLGKNLAHATASQLLQSQWTKQPYPLSADASIRELHLWAPYVIFYKGLYYMYYCAGDVNSHSTYRIHLATSENLYDWRRHPANPMVVDGYDARDPFILRLKNKWVMYYTATSAPNGGNHTVEAVTSKDLVHWSGKKRVFTDKGIGTWGGNTESPFVVRRGKYYYLFIGPGDDYKTTKVYRSKNPFKWTDKQEVAVIKTHAAEIIRDINGNWFISHCGIEQGGVFLAPLYWNDGQDDNETSLKIKTAD